jgi:hypothetical protein
MPEDLEQRRMGETIGDPNSEEGIIFNRAVTTYGNLGDIFQIFTTGETTNELPNMEPC